MDVLLCKPWPRWVAAMCIAFVPAGVVAEGPSFSLDEILEKVLVQNPRLGASGLSVEAQNALHAYAGQRKNPEIALEVEDLLGTGRVSGFSNAQTTLSVRQTFELGGKRAARSEVAHAAVLVATADLTRERVKVLAETVIRFVHVVADQRRLEAAENGRGLAQRGVAFAKRRVKSGAASMVEERRASIAMARSEISVEHAEHELRASKRRLSMMWGGAEADFGLLSADLFSPPEVHSYEELAARVQSNPDLLHNASEQSRQRVQAALAHTEANSDLSLSLGARRLEGPSAYGVVMGVSVALPVFSKNQGPVAAAQIKTRRLEAVGRVKRVGLLDSLYGYVQEVSHANQELRLLHENILPDAQAVLELVTAGFASGRFSQIELLEAQRTLVELERERIDAAEQTWAIAVRIYGIVDALPGIVSRLNASAPTLPVKRGFGHE